MDTQPLKMQRTTRIRTKSQKSVGAKQKKDEISIAQLITASAITSSSKTTCNSDQHTDLKRKTPARRQKSKQVVKNNNTTKDNAPVIAPPEKSSNELGSVKIDPWISEQAKVVLAMGRGSAALQAVQGKKNTASTSLKASDVFKKDVTSNELLVGNVREDALKKFQDSISQERKAKGRGRLRQKFAHLINDGTEGSKVESKLVEKEDNQVISSTSSNVRIPAHQRFKQLASKKTDVTFVLPLKYKSLIEMFRCADSVLFLLNRRSETCTFERLKKSVQSMLGKKFTEKHLAQMKTVYPDGFTFRVEKNLKDLNGMPAGPQFTIEANFESSTCSNGAEKQNLNQTVLITRRNIFETALVEFTKKHHQKFLHKLNLKIDDTELHRWHPNFKVDDVPDIKEFQLPQLNVNKTFTSAREILQNNHCIPQVEKALQNVASVSEKKEKAKDCLPPQDNLPPSENKESGSATNKTTGILKGVSSSLLERIRQKEMKKAELEMRRNPEQEKKLAIMSRLPDVVRTLKAYFTTERKAAIALEDCVSKLSRSFSTANSTTHLEEHVRLLNELVPDWLNIATVRKCPYIKLTKNSDINVVIKRLEAIKEKESKR